MTRRSNIFVLIAVVLSSIVIPQLLFYWLVPTDISSRTAVYCFGTVLTVVSPIAIAISHWFFGLRKSVGVLICASILELIAIIVCGVLLITNVVPRTALFVLTILSLVYIMCLVPLLAGVMQPARGEVNPVMVSETEEMNHEHCSHHDLNRLPHKANRVNNDSAVGTSENAGTTGQYRKPLPPRNR